MNSKKIYTVIAVVFGVAYAYNLSGLVKMLMHDSLSNTCVVETINKEDAYRDKIIFDAELTNPQP